MTSEEGHTIEHVSELEAELVDIKPIEIDTEAQQLDVGQTLTERIRLLSRPFAGSAS